MAAVFKLACVVLALMVVAVPYAAEGALTCGQVTGKVKSCVGYLLGGALSPSCCPGLKGLLSMASTTPDRQAICNCFKNAAKASTKINMALAAALPRKCGVNIPYKISPSTDCSKVK